ncbi:MAG: SLOG family protein [Acutalibacteraceae bacterium]
MKVAVIGSRTWKINNLGDYLPENVTEIISGGASGVDTCAREYAKRNLIKLTEFLPDYGKYGRAAPLRRNIEIIENADLVLAFWDGSSHGTGFVIQNCRKKGVPIKVYRLKQPVKYFND